MAANGVSIPFTKLVGTGNDFVLVDTARHKLSALKTRWPQVARAICDRRYGVGADGLLVLEPAKTADAKMRIFNPDGSEAQMCGNGARCVALYVKNAAVKGGGWRVKGEAVTIQTKAGMVSAEVRGDQVAMWMPEPKILDLHNRVKVDGTAYELCVLDTGVPHAVLFVDDLEGVDVQGIGRVIRSHAAFQPHGTNVNFVKPINYHTIAVRTYERGVEAETLACGTGSVASAIAAVIWERISGVVREEGLKAAVRRSELVRRAHELYLQRQRELAGKSPAGHPPKPFVGVFKQATEYDAEDRTMSAAVFLRRVVVSVRPRSGDEVRVSFQVLVDEMKDEQEVRDVILEGGSKKVFEGVFPWTRRAAQ